MYKVKNVEKIRTSLDIAKTLILSMFFGLLWIVLEEVLVNIAQSLAQNRCKC